MAEAGLILRGVVNYVDGYGTNEKISTNIATAYHDGLVVKGKMDKRTSLPSGSNSVIEQSNGTLITLSLKGKSNIPAPYGGGDLLGTGLIRFINPETGSISQSDVTFGSGKTIVNGIEKTSDNGYIVYGQTKEDLFDTKPGGATDAFVIKYKSNGTQQWSRVFNTHLHESISGLDIDDIGNIYLSGRTSFDLSEPRNGESSWYDQQLGGRYYAAFSAKLSPEGEVLTLNAFHPHYNTGGIDIAANSQGSLVATYLAGSGRNNPTDYTYISQNNKALWTINSSVESHYANVEKLHDSDNFAITTSSNEVSLVDAYGSIYKNFKSQSGTHIYDIEVTKNSIYLLSRALKSDNLTSNTPLMVTTYDLQGELKASAEKITGTAEFIHDNKYDLTVLENGNYVISGSSKEQNDEYREVIIFNPKLSDKIICGSSLYTIVEGPSWTHASSNARQLGGYLASINSEKEDHFVNTKLALPGHKDRKTENWFWIGIRGNTDGTITLSSGEDIKYSNWHSGGGPNDPLLSTYLSSIGYSGVLEPYIRTSGEWSSLRGTNHSGNTIDVNPNGFDISGIAEIPFIRRGDSAYVIVEGPTWEEAEANANSLGGHLVSINDADENRWLHSTFEIGAQKVDKKSTWTGFWSGLTDKESEGSWKWINGEEVEYLNWGHDEPNAGNIDNYMLLGWSEDQKWDDASNNLVNAHNVRLFGIAEIKLTPNNAPTGKPILTGDFEVGKTISIDASAIKDTDNHEYWSPTYQYSWEVSSNNGSTWAALSNSDATDADNTYTLTSEESDKQLRGVVRYLDGYGTNEMLLSDASLVKSVVNRSVLSIDFDGDAAIGQSIALPISLDGANGLQAFELVLAYDSDIFSLPTSSSAYSAPDLTSDWSFLLNNNVPGQIKIAGFGIKSLTANSGALINLNLNINDGIDPTTTTLDLVSASLNEDAIDVSLQDLDLQITPPSFQVLGARQLASGLALKLYEAPDLDALNLYDGNDTSVDQPDLLLTRTDGQTVDDLSIHWQADSKELFLLQTDSLTGAALTPNTSDRLDPGDYKLTIASRADGLIAAASGDWLDGDQDGTPGGDYSYSFSKTTSDHLISIGDTTRGPGQKLGLNGHDTRANITGLPVLISTETAIKQLQGTISYDAGALTQISLIEGRQLPSSWSLTYQDDGNGTITYSASGNSALRGTDQEIFRLAATVDADASYGSSTLIQATAASTDDPSLSFDNDPSLIVLAYSGDATGNGSLSSLDASLAARVVVDLDSGFDAFDDYAPMLLGDTTGNGNLSSLDSSHILRRVVGLETDSFPEIPG